MTNERWILALLLLGPALTGCIGQSGADQQTPASRPVDQAQTEEDSPWSRTMETLGTFLVGEGRPFRGFGAINGCHIFGFDVPASTTTMTVTVSSQILNASRPGFGDASLLIAAEGGPDFHPIDDLPPERLTVHIEEEVALTVEDPSPGDWTAIVWPNQLVVNQAYPLTVHLDGDRDPPTEPLEFDTSGELSRSCDEDNTPTAPTIVQPFETVTG